MTADEIFAASPEFHIEASRAFHEMADSLDPVRAAEVKAEFLKQIEKFKTVENAVKATKEAMGL